MLALSLIISFLLFSVGSRIKECCVSFTFGFVPEYFGDKYDNFDFFIDAPGCDPSF